jgi:hypothetical protein
MVADHQGGGGQGGMRQPTSQVWVGGVGIVCIVSVVQFHNFLVREFGWSCVMSIVRVTTLRGGW